MKKRHLQGLLRRLTGHLVVEDKEQQLFFDSLIGALSETDLPEAPDLVVQSDLSIGKAEHRRHQSRNQLIRKLRFA